MDALLVSLSGFGAVLANGVAAFSFAALVGGLGGLLLIAAALVLGAYLPATLRHGLVAAGLLLLAGSALFQAGQARGAHRQAALDAARALDAERDRRAAAERVTEALAAQATRDIDAARADAAKLKDLLDAHAKDPGRAGACLPRDLSRRLRAL